MSSTQNTCTITVVTDVVRSAEFEVFAHTQHSFPCSKLQSLAHLINLIRNYVSVNFVCCLHFWMAVCVLCRRN